MFEEKHWCSTYLLLSPLNSDFDFEQAAFDPADFRIEGYFTLSSKAIHFGENVSEEMIHAMFDWSENVSEQCSAIMIGHLGKYVDEPDGYVSCLSGPEILSAAVGVVAEINEMVPVTNIVLECDIENKKVQKIYTDYGFDYLQNNGELNMYLMKTY
jgi:hypothetical protein